MSILIDLAKYLLGLLSTSSKLLSGQEDCTKGLVDSWYCTPLTNFFATPTCNATTHEVAKLFLADKSVPMIQSLLEHFFKSTCNAIAHEGSSNYFFQWWSSYHAAKSKNRVQFVIMLIKNFFPCIILFLSMFCSILSLVADTCEDTDASYQTTHHHDRTVILT